MGRSTALLLGIFGVLSIYPFLDPLPHIQRVVDTAFAASILWALYRTTSRPVFWAVTLLVIGSTVNGLTLDLSTARGVPVVRYACNTIVLAVIAVATLLHTLRRRRITVEEVAGALLVYLLVGLVWGHFYAVLDGLAPGSIAFPTESSSPQDRLESAVYFSFVTLTTLGYGDIVPLTARARALALSETILGQVYLVTTVAHVVAIHVATTVATGNTGDTSSARD